MLIFKLTNFNSFVLFVSCFELLRIYKCYQQAEKKPQTIINKHPKYASNLESFTLKIDLDWKRYLYMKNSTIGIIDLAYDLDLIELQNSFMGKIYVL